MLCGSDRWPEADGGAGRGAWRGRLLDRDRLPSQGARGRGAGAPGRPGGHPARRAGKLLRPRVTAAALSALPLLALFAFLQRHFVRSVATTAIKG